MKNKKLKISVFIIFLAIWQISSMIVNSEVIIPSINATIKQIVVVISEDDFYLTILNSLLRSITGFLTAVMLGVFSGVLSFCNKFLKEIFTFITKICASVPTVAIILLMLIWLRPNFVSMLIGCIMVFPMIYQSVFCSMYDYDKKIIKMLDVYNIDLK
ncbi:ABC transporter permease, partial [Peptoanaerobacter stomatis]